MTGEIACPCCSGHRPALHDLDILIIDLINDRGLSEHAQAVIEAAYLAAGRPAQTERIFDRMYEFDPDGGPSPARAYADLREALAELAVKLDGTGLAVTHDRRTGYRVMMDVGGAYVASASRVAADLVAIDEQAV